MNAAACKVLERLAVKPTHRMLAGDSAQRRNLAGLQVAASALVCQDHQTYEI
jgi:hypothetical protein